MLVVPSPKKQTETSFCAEILRAPGRAAGDRQMRADDGVGAHHVMLDRGQMHRAALAAHQADVAQHQFAEHPLHRRAARQRMRVAAIGAEGFVALAHRDPEPRRDRFLPKRQMAGALDQVLQEQIVGALLAVADFDLQAEQLQPRFDADVVVARRALRRCGASFGCHLQSFHPGLLCRRPCHIRRGAASEIILKMII